MTDLFKDKAADYDARPLPQQISDGVTTAIADAIELDGTQTVMDFGAGTGLIATKLASKVGRLIAVDVSQSMLDQLAQKEELRGRVDVRCQNILEEPLGEQVDLVVSAMAMHHVEDTAGLASQLFDHTVPGGKIALADLDAEDGDFHPPDIEGVYHSGFDRSALGEVLSDAGFQGVSFRTACEVERDGKRYPIFLVTATKPA